MKQILYATLLLALLISCHKDKPAARILTFTLHTGAPGTVYANYFAGINGTTITVKDTNTWTSERIVVIDSMRKVYLMAWAETPVAGNQLKAAIKIDGKVIQEAVGDSATVAVEYSFP